MATNPSYQPKRPVHLYTPRPIAHHIDPLTSHGVCTMEQVKEIMSLEHQVRFSAAQLERELAARGLRYELEIRSLCAGCGAEYRWEYVANGAVIAVIERDYAYSCFDESATSLLDALRNVLDWSRVPPKEKAATLTLRPGKSWSGR